MKASNLWIGWIGLFGVTVLGAGLMFAQAPVPPPAPAASSQEQAQPPAPDAPPDSLEQKYRLAVDVQLVNVNATVLDEDGKYMDNLKPEDFQLFEDSKEQKVAFFAHDRKVPISVGVLVDTSGSMRHKLQQALQTVREVSLALSPQDEMFLLTFDDGVEMRQKFTSNQQDVQRALRGIRSGGETAVYDAIKVALKEMDSARNHKKVLMLVSDGFDTKSKTTATQAQELLKRSETILYAIGIDDDDNDPVAQRDTRYHIYYYMLGQLSAIGGGQTFKMFTGRNYALDGLAQIILEELHQQYTLSYYPTGEGNGSWRKLEVKVKKTGAQIRTRMGYYVGQTGN